MSIIYSMKKVYWKMRNVWKKWDSDWNRFYTQRILFPNTYKKYAGAPVNENKVLFIEVSQEEITNSFQVMFDELAQNYNYDIHSHFLRRTYASREEYNRRCCEMLQDAADAKYIFINDACAALSCVPLRKETFVTQLWHGCGAFKKFGFGTAELLFGASRKELEKYPNYKNQSLVTVSSPEVEWAYVQAMGMEQEKENVQGIGCSRTDIFYDPAFIEDAHEKLYTLMPSAKGKKVILYAPTFRGRVAKAKTPNMLSVKMFFEALGDEYVLIFKHHPFVRKPAGIPAAYEDFARDFTNAMSIEELLCVSDVCISDYSSLIFEYSLFEKPLIFFAYDLDEYFDWRGFFYDYDELTPGPVLTTNLEMIDYIQNLDTRFDRQKVIDFRRRFMSACDGHATEKIMKKVFGEESLNAHRKPEEQRMHEPLWAIPNGRELASVRSSRVERLRGIAAGAEDLYRRSCIGPVDPGKVVFLGREITPTMKTLKKKMDETGQLRTVDVNVDDSWKDKIAELGDAGCIIIEGASDVLNCLEIRPETKVIQLTLQTLPVDRRGYASLRYMAGFDRDLTELAPLHRNYTCVPVGSEFAAECYSRMYGMENTADVFRPIGSVPSDVLFDPKLRDSVRKKLTEWFPQTAGKKIIYYHPEVRVNPLASGGKPMLPEMLYMNEYLKDEYVVIYSYPWEGKLKTNVSEYYKQFICNLAKTPVRADGQPASGYRELKPIECIAAADLVISDYQMEDMECLAPETPILFYAPDHAIHAKAPDSFLDYEELTEGILYTDTRKMVDQIVHMETYPMERLKTLKKKYFTWCDGKAAERLIDYIRES